MPGGPQTRKFIQDSASAVNSQFNAEQPLPKCALTRLAERSKRTLRHFSEIEGNNPQLCLQWRGTEANLGR